MRVFRLVRVLLCFDLCYVLRRFSEVVVLLEKIPIVPSLAVFTLSNAKTMLEWINAQVGQQIDIKVVEIVVLVV